MTNSIVSQASYTSQRQGEPHNQNAEASTSSAPEAVSTYMTRADWIKAHLAGDMIPEQMSAEEKWKQEPYVSSFRLAGMSCDNKAMRSDIRTALETNGTSKKARIKATNTINRVGAGYESFYQKNADAEAYRQFAKSVGIDDETLTAYIHGTMTAEQIEQHGMTLGDQNQVQQAFNELPIWKMPMMRYCDPGEIQDDLCDTDTIDAIRTAAREPMIYRWDASIDRKELQGPEMLGDEDKSETDWGFIAKSGGESRPSETAERDQALDEDKKHADAMDQFYSELTERLGVDSEAWRSVVNQTYKGDSEAAVTSVAKECWPILSDQAAVEQAIDKLSIWTDPSAKYLNQEGVEVGPNEVLDKVRLRAQHYHAQQSFQEVAKRHGVRLAEYGSGPVPRASRRFDTVFQAKDTAPEPEMGDHGSAFLVENPPSLEEWITANQAS